MKICISIIDALYYIECENASGDIVDTYTTEHQEEVNSTIETLKNQYGNRVKIKWEFY